MKYQVSFLCETLFSCVKIAHVFFHMWQDHCCYGYIINLAFGQVRSGLWKICAPLWDFQYDIVKKNF